MSATSPDTREQTCSRYPGTRPFSDSEADRARFFGRDAEAEQLYLRILSVPLLVQFGRSGLGKTSLLQAGVFPLLREKELLPVMIRLNDPADSLLSAVRRSLADACRSQGLDFAPEDVAGVWELLSKTGIWSDDLLLEPVLVFDQFEEVFTLRDAAFRAELAAEIGALATGNPPERLHGQHVPRPDVKIVISLREDYLGSLEEFAAAIPGLFHERLRLEPLSVEAARDAITRPASLVAAPGEEPFWSPPFELEPAALDEVMKELKGRSSEIEPFQLQLLARHAEQIAHAKGAGPNGIATVAATDFRGSHSFDAVFRNFYREALQKLAPAQRKRAALMCEEGLLGASGHRLLPEENEIISNFGVTPATLATLAQARLIRREQRAESTLYEISHDRLAESIRAARGSRMPRKTKRILMAASAAAVVLIAILAWSAVRVGRARNSAENLLTFFLDERFLGEVRDTGRMSLLEGVHDYLGLAGNDRENVRSRNAINRGLALRNGGDISLARGKVADAVKLFEEAVAAFRSDADDLRMLRETARTQTRLCEALVFQGFITRAHGQCSAAAQAWRTAARQSEGKDENLDDCVGLGLNLVYIGTLENRMGRMKEGIAHAEEATDIAANILFGPGRTDGECTRPARRFEPFPNAGAVEILSEAALLRAGAFGFEADANAAVAFTRQVQKARPGSVTARKNAATALAHRGNTTFFTKPEPALADYRAARAELAELQRLDPNNRVWERDHAAIQLLLAESMTSCLNETVPCNPGGTIEDVEAMALEAQATIRKLQALDPTNTTVASDYGWSLRTLAGVFAVQGRNPEHLAGLQSAVEAYQRSRSDKADTEATIPSIFLLLDQAGAFAAQGRTADTDKTLQQAIGELERIVAAHPDVPFYTSYLAYARNREGLIRSVWGDPAVAQAAMTQAETLQGRYNEMQELRQQELDRLRTAAIERSHGASALFEKANYAESLRQYQSCLADAREYLRRQPAGFHAYRDLHTYYASILTLQEQLGKVNEKSELLRASLNAAELGTWLAEEGDEKMDTIVLEKRLDLGIALWEAGKLDEALAIVQAVATPRTAISTAEQSSRAAIAKCAVGLIWHRNGQAGWEEEIRSGLIQLHQAGADYAEDESNIRVFLADELEAEGRKDDGAKERALAAALAPKQASVQ